MKQTDIVVVFGLFIISIVELVPHFAHASGSGLIYSTYLGDVNLEVVYGMDVDVDGNAYVTGRTDSTSFPLTPSVFDRVCSYNEGFVTKLNSDGTALVYSTFLGGDYDDEAFRMLVDDSGYAYIVGYTEAHNFPVIIGSYDTTYNGGVADMFVTKLNTDASGLVYSTYIGGKGSDIAYDLALDSTGCIYVIGTTDSDDFPVTAGVFDPTYNGLNDIVVCKLNPDGITMLYSTYIGGTSYDNAAALEVTGSGEVYLTGYTYSVDFPTTRGSFVTSKNGSTDIIVSKLDPYAATLLYSTYIGCSGKDYSEDIALDTSGNPVIFGRTEMSDYPVTPGVYDTSFNGGDFDIVVSKLDPTCSSLVFSTFLGGSFYDWVCSAELDGTDKIYMTGYVFSPDFPVTPDAFDLSFDGDPYLYISDAFLSVMSADGSSLLYSTFIGGLLDDSGNALALDSSGFVYVAGLTESTDFPVTLGAYDESYNLGYDAFICKFDVSGSSIDIPVLKGFAFILLPVLFSTIIAISVLIANICKTVQG